mmetsp:Transcript_6487/g.14896  ORF Transcript_6487/g.14896 Transcript_6487/m.14896 type:complete len:577 (-) Transcript_6487:59-1789(-)
MAEDIQVLWRPSELDAALRNTTNEQNKGCTASPAPLGKQLPEAWPQETDRAVPGDDLADPPGQRGTSPSPLQADSPGSPCLQGTPDEADDFQPRCVCKHCDAVPRQEVLRWWEEVNSEMQMIAETVEAKHELWRAKMEEKDKVIKRLFVKLKQLAETPSQPPNVFGLSTTPASTGMRSPMRAANRVAPRATPGSPSGSSRAMIAAQSTDGLQALLSNPRLGRAGSLSPSNRIDAINGRGTPTEERAGAPRVRRGTADSEKLGLTAAALQSPTAAASRKTQRPREAAERVQILYLRQEIAQLRRQNAELQGQVRAGDAKVDQLSNVVKEMQEVQRSRVSWKESPQALVGSGAAAQPASQGAGSGASTPSTAIPGVATTPAGGQTGVLGASEQRSVQRRMSMDGQPASGVIVASSRVSAAATQAQRASRRAAAEAAGSGERGSSVSRPSSAFQRHKDQIASRRIIVAPQATAPAPVSQMSRMFSPRSRQWQSSRSIASCASLREPAAASIAQAAQAVAMAAQADPHTGPHVRGTGGSTTAGTAASGTSSASVAAFRSASVDNRNRTRISTARRSLRRH